MGGMASQITRPAIVYPTVYSGADQRKHQSSASLAFVGIHRWPVNSPHKWSVTRKMFPFDDVIMLRCQSSRTLKNEDSNLCSTIIHPINISCWIKLMYLTWRLWPWGIWQLRQTDVRVWITSTPNSWMTYLPQKKCFCDLWDVPFINRSKVLSTNHGLKPCKDYGAKIWNVRQMRYSYANLKFSQILEWPKCSCSVCFHFI